MKKMTAVLILMLVLTVIPVPAAADTQLPAFPAMPDVLAEYVMIAETTSGQILYAKNEHTRAAPASLVKIMTVLLVLEAAADGSISLDDVVTVTASSLEGLHPMGSSINLQPGDMITVRDLCYGAMVASGNDACNVLAEHVAGSVNAFIELMNRRARELGCVNTNFGNTCGLDLPEQYTTAYDMFIITMEARKWPEFLRIAYTDSYRIERIDGYDRSISRDLVTTNSLISRRRTGAYFYANAKGVKTGRTTQAGYCLVSMAVKNRLETVCVVMNSDLYQDERIGSFVDSRMLHEWVFNNFSKDTIRGGEPIGSLPVLMGRDTDTVILVSARNFEPLIPSRLRAADLQREVILYCTEPLTAPVDKDDTVYGEAWYYFDFAAGEEDEVSFYGIRLSFGDNVFYSGPYPFDEGVLRVFYDENEGWTQPLEEGAVRIFYGGVPLVADTRVELDVQEQIGNALMSFFKNPWVLGFGGFIVGVIILYMAVALIHNSRRKRARSRRSVYRGKRR
jgi:D-alanyl-D-alanine carboxypeptidase (penicillin-binding protein 5/6)